MIDATKVVFAFKPSLRRAFFYAFIYAAVVLYGRYATNLDRSFNHLWLIMLGVLLLSLAYAFLRRATTEYVVNETGVMATTGIIARNTSTLPYQRITNAAARQTPLDRILFLTSVFFDGAGGPLPEVVFFRITNSEAKSLVSYLKAYQQNVAESEGLQQARAAGV